MQCKRITSTKRKIKKLYFPFNFLLICLMSVPARHKVDNGATFLASLSSRVKIKYCDKSMSNASILRSRKPITAGRKK